MMTMDDAVALQRLVNIEASARRSFETARANGDFGRAAHFARRLQMLDSTISKMSLGIMHITE